MAIHVPIPIMTNIIQGRQARLPVEIQFPTEADEDESHEAFLKKQCDAFVHLNCSREEAADNIKSAQKKQKKHYDKKAKEVNFKVGDRVLVHNTRKTTRKGGKLASCWTGPFVVQSVLQKGTYKLEGLQRAVNGNRLKLYVTCTKNKDEDAPEQDKCGSDSESDIQYPQDTGASRKRFRKDKGRSSNNEQASGESATQNQDEDAPEQDKCGSDSESDIQYPRDTGASRKRFKRGSVSSESSDTIIITLGTRVSVTDK